MYLNRCHLLKTTKRSVGLVEYGPEYGMLTQMENSMHTQRTNACRHDDDNAIYMPPAIR